jgi:uncharacterized membrane protein
MSSRTCDLNSASLGELAIDVGHLLLQLTQPGLFGALFGLQGAQVVGLAFGLDVALLDLAALARQVGAAALDDGRGVTGTRAAAHQCDLQRGWK